MDLDQLIRAELTAQAEAAPDAAAVLAGVPARARARARRRLVAGAVAVAVAAAVPVAALRPGPAGDAARPPARSMLPEAEIVASCLRRAPALSERSAAAPGRVLAVFADRRGYLAWVGGRNYDLPDCLFGWDGIAAGGPATKVYATEPPPRGYLPDRTPYAVHDGGVGDGGRDHTTAYATGRVSRQVRRLVLRWPGFPPVEAVLAGPYFAGRATADGLVRVPGDGAPAVTAYDAAGRVLRPG